MAEILKKIEKLEILRKETNIMYDFWVDSIISTIKEINETTEKIEINENKEKEKLLKSRIKNLLNQTMTLINTLKETQIENNKGIEKLQKLNICEEAIIDMQEKVKIINRIKIKNSLEGNINCIKVIINEKLY